jgi:2,3-dihydro-2,3-dihydroxybenzoate dehydrogenase
MDPNHSFDGRVALVVGAAGGIGQATARAFAGAGAVVAMADLDADRTRAAADGFPAGRHSFHAVDLARPDGPGALVRDVVETHGRLDIVVGGAGFLRPASLADLEIDDWDRTLAVNLRGNVLLAQAAAKVFLERGIDGRIVVIASIVSRLARLNNVAYAASKAGLVQAVRCMALELAPRGITINAVSPGSTATPMLLEVQMRGSKEALRQAIEGDLATWRLGVPLGHLADPADQAAAILFLASDAARHITGQELFVDGGQTVV